MASLSGKVALITGASRGIGRAIALRLARDGASVAVNYAGAADKAAEVVYEIEAGGGAAAAFQANVAQAADIRALFAHVHQRFGRIDILVINAAVGLVKPMPETSEQDFDRLMNLNVRGAFLLMQQCAAGLADNGRIIAISSGATRKGVANQSIYSASKAALELMISSCAMELGARGITANALAAGPIETEMLAGYLDEFPAQRQILLSRSPFKRMGTPQDMADIAAFFASDDSRWITGQTILCDGGAR